ncbi:MAG TPA: zinc ribbon domain-containing protein [Thermoplasmata archaeon]
MPTSGGDKLCPICDSPLQPGSKKCGFCGTDLSIFEIEVEAPKPSTPAQPQARVSMDVKVQEVLSKATSAERATATKPSEPAPPQKRATQVASTSYYPGPGPSKAPAPAAPPAGPRPAPRVEAEAKPPPAKEPPKPVQESFECPECGNSVPATASSCSKCGVMFAEEGTEMFQCPACNTLVDVNAKVCPGCGALFVEPEEAEAAMLPTKHEAPSAAPAAPAEAPSQKAEAKLPPRPEPKADEKKGLFGMFRLGKKEAEPPSKPAAKPGIREVGKPPAAAPSAKKPSGEPQVMAAPAKELAGAPPSKDKGRELARMVAEMKPLLTLSREKDVDIGESKQLIDEAAAAGRERQLDKAIDLVQRSKSTLTVKIDTSLGQEMSKINDELNVAREFGGDVSRAATYMQEVARARNAGDFEAAYVYIDKIKNELQPITGRYNDYRARLASLKDMIADCEYFIVDTKEARSQLVEATKALDGRDFDRTDSLLKAATERLNKVIPARMNEELQKAKDALINAKASNVNITPMITVLKSATNYMKSGDFGQALKEMREFRDIMKKVG